MKNEPKKEKKESWVDQLKEDNEFQSMRSNDVLMEDPEFPIIRSNEPAMDDPHSPANHAHDTAIDHPQFSTLRSDVDRKKAEIKNSTIGGF